MCSRTRPQCRKLLLVDDYIQSMMEKSSTVAFKHCSQPRNLNPLSCRCPFFWSVRSAVTSFRQLFPLLGGELSSSNSCGRCDWSHRSTEKNNMLLVICHLACAPLDNSQIDTENARKETNPFLDPSKYTRFAIWWHIQKRCIYICNARGVYALTENMWCMMVF